MQCTLYSSLSVSLSSYELSVELRVNENVSRLLILHSQIFSLTALWAGKFSKIFDRCARRQIFIQIFENPCLAQRRRVGQPVVSLVSRLYWIFRDYFVCGVQCEM